MQVIVEIPDDLMSTLLPSGVNASRALLEEAVAAAYRQHRLTMQQVSDALGFATRMESDAFLQRHEIFDYTPDDLGRDLATLDRLAASKSTA